MSCFLSNIHDSRPTKNFHLPICLSERRRNDVSYHFLHVLLTAMTNHCIIYVYFVILLRLRISVSPELHSVRAMQCKRGQSAICA